MCNIVDVEFERVLQTVTPSFTYIPFCLFELFIHAKEHIIYTKNWSCCIWVVMGEERTARFDSYMGMLYIHKAVFIMPSTLL